MTEDELVEAVRADIVGRSVSAPVPATLDDIEDFEQASGYRLPPLLARLFTEVANGGFGPRKGVFGIRGHNWHTGGMFPDMTEAARESREDPEWVHRGWCVPLIDWGCCLLTHIDCRDPAGPLWGWDPNGCCLDHALFSLDQTLAELLEEALTTEYRELFYAEYFADRKAAGRECVPLQWHKGRIEPATTP